MADTSSPLKTATATGRLGESGGLRWWPSLLGLAVAVLAGTGPGDGTGLAVIVVLCAFVYLAVAAQGSPRAAWAWLVLGFLIVTVGKLLDLGGLTLGAFLGLAVVLVGGGVARGRWAEPGGLRRQTAAMVVFGAAAALGYLVGATAGGLVVAAGLVGHGVWDAVHHHRNRVVPRCYAEFCGVLDVVLAGLVAWAAVLHD